MAVIAAIGILIPMVLATFIFRSYLRTAAEPRASYALGGYAVLLLLLALIALPVLSTLSGS